ncbi:MAG: Flp family type IVb pilin [Armatimonadota bacterium]|jgi:Flp pilus assembly pilin Flp
MGLGEIRRTARRVRRDLGGLIADESAVTTLEYALTLALVAVAAIFAYQRFGVSTGELAAGSTAQFPGGDGNP